MSCRLSKAVKMLTWSRSYQAIKQSYSCEHIVENPFYRTRFVHIEMRIPLMTFAHTKILRFIEKNNKQLLKIDQCKSSDVC